MKERNLQNRDDTAASALRYQDWLNMAVRVSTGTHDLAHACVTTTACLQEIETTMRCCSAIQVPSHFCVTAVWAKVAFELWQHISYSMQIPQDGKREAHWIYNLRVCWLYLGFGVFVVTASSTFESAGTRKCATRMHMLLQSRFVWCLLILTGNYS